MASSTASLNCQNLGQESSNAQSSVPQVSSYSIYASPFTISSTTSISSLTTMPAPFPLKPHPTVTTSDNPIVVSGRLSPSSPHQSRQSTCILTPCSNSHPFDERRILVTRSEEDAVKIGRSVVRLQPSPNNAIFDCKVLSRNHAILWQNSNGKFLIKDTRSSNGTFINNERLSASGDESEPKELFSGDILQLGVEIVDNAKKVASGCLTCIVRLFNERGEECAGRPQSDHNAFPLLQQVPNNYTLVRNEKFFILDQYIKEAKHRENLLGQKLQTLEEQLRTAQDALQSKWQEQVNQELLMSRIELLESQLMAKRATSTNNAKLTDNNEFVEQQRLTKELKEAVEDRGHMEQMAKEQLRVAQEQMQETSMRLHDAEMGLVNVEEECTFLRQRCADFETQLGRQIIDYDALLRRYNEVCAQLSATEKATNASVQPRNNDQPSLNGGDEGPKSGREMSQHTSEKETMDFNKESKGLEESRLIEVPSSDNEGENKRNAICDTEHVAESDPLNTTNEKLSELTRRCEEYQQKLAEYEHKLLFVQNSSKDEKLSLQRKSMECHCHIDKITGSTMEDNKCPSSDFQVFLLSAFPFLLLFLLFFSPVFYFFGSFTSTVRPVMNSEEIEDRNHDLDANDEENGEPQKAHGEKGDCDTCL